MPAVIDAPESVDQHTHDLQPDQPQERTPNRGFWYIVRQYVWRHRVHTSYRAPSSPHVSRHAAQSPMACLAQDHARLYLLGFWGLHYG